MTSPARRWSSRLAWGGVAALAALLLWGLAEPYAIDESREAVTIPDLPPSWEGARVAVIADFQVGMWAANTTTIERIVRRLVEYRPAAVLIAGDFTYKADDRIGEVTGRVVELVHPLTEAGIPTLAVLGNHDYSLDYRDDPINHRVAAAVEAALEGVGVRVLHNQAVPLRRGAGVGEGGALYVVGIGDEWAGDDQGRAAIAQVPAGAARIAFMHNPGSFRNLPAGTAPLAIAAHTHGGQIAVPFAPHWSWMSLVKDDVVEADGWASDGEEPAGNRLYVNVGIGFSDVPIRINAPPELTLFTLRAGPVPGP